MEAFRSKGLLSILSVVVLSNLIGTTHAEAEADPVLTGLASTLKAHANHRFKWSVHRRYFRNKELEVVIDREFEPQLKAAKDSNERSELRKRREEMKRDQAGAGERKIIFELDFFDARNFILKQRFMEPESAFEYYINKEVGHFVDGERQEVSVEPQPSGFLGATVAGDPLFLLAEAIESDHLKLEKRKDEKSRLILHLEEKSTKREIVVHFRKPSLQILSLTVNDKDGQTMTELEARYPTESSTPQSVLYTRYGGDGMPSYTDEWTLESIKPITPSKTGVVFTVPKGYRVVSKECPTLFH